MDKMNERIKQLARECGLPTDSDRTLTHEVERFAELLIRECIQVGGPEDSYADEWFKAKADSVQQIKKHFGAE